MELHDGWRAAPVVRSTGGAPAPPSPWQPPSTPGNSLSNILTNFAVPASVKFPIYPYPCWARDSTRDSAAGSSVHGEDGDTMKERVADVYQAVTSKPAQRTLLYTVLLGFGAAVLYGSAIVAYVLFYHNYLPDQIKAIPVYLQYVHDTHHPYGMAALERANLKNQQEYDINVALTLPRSPANLDRNNFMVQLLLLDSGAAPLSATAVATRADFLTDKTVLFASSRPAILPYRAPLVSLASELLLVGYKVLFPSAEKTKLVIPIAERLSFGRSALLPSSLLLDIKTSQTLQTYSAQVVFVARLRGLRWLMYNWRISSFVVFTTLFWAVEVLFMLLAFLAFGLLPNRGKDEAVGVKEESAPAPAVKLEPRDDQESSETKALPSTSTEGKSRGRAGHGASAEQGEYEEDAEDDDVQQKKGQRVESSVPSYDGEGGGSASGVVRRRTSQHWGDDR